MKVLNLFGGPGVGKSTTAAGLFFKMKNLGIKVELVTEFAKDLTYEGGHTLPDQLAVLGEQHRRLSRLEGQVDWAITDSPLLLSLVYATRDYDSSWFNIAVRGAFNRFDNVNYFLTRCKPFQGYGRSQTECESRFLDAEVLSLVIDLAKGYKEIPGDEMAPDEICKHLRLAEPSPTAFSLSFPDYALFQLTGSITTKESPH